MVTNDLPKLEQKLSYMTKPKNFHTERWSEKLADLEMILFKCGDNVSHVQSLLKTFIVLISVVHIKK